MHYFVYMERLINDFNEDCLLLSLIKPHAYGNTEKHVTGRNLPEFGLIKCFILRQKVTALESR